MLCMSNKRSAETAGGKQEMTRLHQTRVYMTIGTEMKHD